MPLTLDLSVSDLAATRFAVSPLSETVSALQLLGGCGRDGRNLRWLRWAADQLAGQPLDLSWTWPLLVHDRPSWPQFLLSAPVGAASTIDDDLAAMRRTTAPQVRASLGRVFGAELPPAAAELDRRPRPGLRAIAAELRAAHDRLVAPHWRRIRAVLDADIAYRARQLATGGAELLFADLHPDLRWTGERLVLDRHHARRGVVPGPGGLVLLPVVLGGGSVLIKGNTTTQTTLRYPARGSGTLWTAGTGPPRGSTVRLLGRSRATLLEAVRSPATTTDLARALQVTPSAVSQNLRVLRECGLVARERVGRTVLYLVTEAGVALLGPQL